MHARFSYYLDLPSHHPTSLSAALPSTLSQIKFATVGGGGGDLSCWTMRNLAGDLDRDLRLQEVRRLARATIEQASAEHHVLKYVYIPAEHRETHQQKAQTKASATAAKASATTSAKASVKASAKASASISKASAKHQQTITVMLC